MGKLKKETHCVDRILGYHTCKGRSKPPKQAVQVPGHVETQNTRVGPRKASLIYWQQCIVMTAKESQHQPFSNTYGHSEDFLELPEFLQRPCFGALQN
jgi:hypothetical protein